jgi:hypothetical protein
VRGDRRAHGRAYHQACTRGAPAGASPRHRPAATPGLWLLPQVPHRLAEPLSALLPAPHPRLHLFVHSDWAGHTSNHGRTENALLLDQPTPVSTCDPQSSGAQAPSASRAATWLSFQLLNIENNHGLRWEVVYTRHRPHGRRLYSFRISQGF